jgi:hypothetical protein
VIYTSHSAGGGDTHAQGLTVVGILEESHSSYDNVVFTQIKTLWEMHDHGDEHAEEAADEHEGEHEDEADGEHEEHHHDHGTVCAILINTKNPGYAMQLVQENDGKIITTEDGEPLEISVGNSYVAVLSYKNSVQWKEVVPPETVPESTEVTIPETTAETVTETTAD